MSIVKQIARNQYVCKYYEFNEHNNPTSNKNQIIM